MARNSNLFGQKRAFIGLEFTKMWKQHKKISWTSTYYKKGIVNPKRKLIFIITIILFLISCQESLPASSSSSIETSNAKVYRVRMKTRFVVPSSGAPIEELRVWHALPTKREWSETNTQVGATQICWIPSTGKQQYEKLHDSHHVFWDQTNLTPGNSLSFESEFTVRSPIRKFNLKTAPTKWEDYSASSLPYSGKSQNIHFELTQIADRIRASNTPPAAVLEFCKWLFLNITYDASVSYDAADVTSAMKNRRGHCGHYSEMLIQLSSRVGIPIRQVFGLNLYAPDGITDDRHKIRADYTNVHTWVEVYFPYIGWVEADPTIGDQAFTIPAGYIQNNKWFQNYIIWINQNGEWKQPEWRYQDGSYISDYGIENIISYSVQ